MTSSNYLELMFEAVEDADRVLILPHNDPDPDAIASSLALQYLLAQKLKVASEVVYRGIIGRAENKALVRYLGSPLRRLADSDWGPRTAVALIDTQPGAGNNALPSDWNPAIVVDHHPTRQTPASGQATRAFIDIRPSVGATSSILTDYMKSAGVTPGNRLATALFYGIKTDTMGLGRGLNSTDVAAYFYLQPHVDVEALVQIEQAQVPVDYFKSFDTALRAARIYDGAVISYVGQMKYPDLAAEMADLLLRLQGTRWVLCIGVYQEKLILAVRTRRQQGAGQLVREIVGSRGSAGGHGSMAGGQMLLQAGEDPEQIALELSRRALHHLQVAPDTDGRSLI